jgi:hypothetical protein
VAAHGRRPAYPALPSATGRNPRQGFSLVFAVSPLSRFATDCDADLALEGTTGWRFVVEEIERAGYRAHLADPAETAAKRGRKRRAKTDRAGCDLQLRLLLARELRESWIGGGDRRRSLI